MGVLMGLLRVTQKHKLGSRCSREGLQKLGWAEGRNIRIDFRWAATDDETMSIGFIDKLASKLRPLGANVHISAVIRARRGNGSAGASLEIVC
jgi:hypothetical protein